LIGGEGDGEIQRVKAIHSEVIENYTTLDQRTIGFVLHSEKIEVSVEPYNSQKTGLLSSFIMIRSIGRRSKA